MNASRCVVLGELASGGFGRVFLARDEYLGREVAIKSMREDRQYSQYFECSQLLHEAQALAAVQHPNIVTIYDVGIVNGNMEIVMEYIPGVTVRQLVSRHLVTPYDFLVLAKQMLRGLAAAHEHGILHGDIKPSNVMVSAVSESRVIVKLLDFGMNPSSSSDKYSLLGSALFMAPEIYEGKDHTRQSDLYSLGCLFYYMLTGVMPFDGRDTIEIMAAHCSGDYHPLASLRHDLPEDLCVWVELFLSAKPEMRFKDCGEALEELDGIKLLESRGEYKFELVDGLAQTVKPLTAGSLEPVSLEMQLRANEARVERSEMLMTRKISSALRRYAERESGRSFVDNESRPEVKAPKKIEGCEVLPENGKYWYVLLEGGRKVSLSLRSLGELILGGYVGCSDLVWHEGWNDWRRADECMETGRYLCAYNRSHPQEEATSEPDGEVQEEPQVWTGWEMLSLLAISVVALVAVYLRPQYWGEVLMAFSVFILLDGFLSLKLAESRDGRKWLLTGMLVPVLGDLYYAFYHKAHALKGLTLMLLGAGFLAFGVSRLHWTLGMLHSLAP